MAHVELIHGDMLIELPKLITRGVKVHSVCCDPPYGISFMGRKWDDAVAFRPETWRLCWDLLPPGGHLLAFASTRTYHRIACAIEDAGFEIRDMLAWLYGSGFPKSLNVSKAMDRAAGAEREVVGSKAVSKDLSRNGITGDMHVMGHAAATEVDITAPATDAARAWDGWGTALKPAWEIVCCAQKNKETGNEYDIIGSRLDALELCIWSMLPASAALAFSGLSQSEFDAACGSAPWSAGERSNTRAALSARMDTSQCVSAIRSSLSTVKSWRGCLAAASEAASTSTIATASSTTIDPKIWKSCLSKITVESIILAHRQGNGLSADAGFAERYLTACALSFSATRERSALESVIASGAMLSPDAGGSRPNLDPLVFARKPLQGTVASNVQAFGTGALNIDACRIGTGDDRTSGGPSGKSGDATIAMGGSWHLPAKERPTGARWPANVAHDGSAEVVGAFPDTHGAGFATDGTNGANPANWKGNIFSHGGIGSRHGDSGSAARFFYSSKADAGDRLSSKHPTVKPVDLMRWLVRLVTPPGGTVLDCFSGSGTTAMACMAEGFDCIAVEREAEYVADIRRRIAHVSGQDTPLFTTK